MIPLGILAASNVPGGAVSGYRWYRLLVTSNNGHSQYLAICEVELRATVGGADLTDPTTANTAASASDDAGGTLWSGSAQAAFDDNTVYGGTLETRAQWLSNSTPPSVAVPKWLKYDLGSSTVVAQVAIIGSHTTDTNPSTTCPKDFKIQGSNDNSAWMDLLAPASQTNWTPAEQRLFTL